jgi:hypothetical protein
MKMRQKAYTTDHDAACARIRSIDAAKQRPALDASALRGGVRIQYLQDPRDGTLYAIVDGQIVQGTVW